MFQCKFRDSKLTPNNAKTVNRECTGEEEYQSSGNFTLEMEPQLQFVSDAVMAFAHALRLMHQDLCQGQKGLCLDMETVDGALLLRYLRKVKFIGKWDISTSFDK